MKSVFEEPEELIMTLFRTLDLRGLPFKNGFDLALREFKRLKINGMLEIIIDRKKNFSEAFRKWVVDHGHRTSNMDDGSQTMRVFIRKGCKPHA